MRAAAASGRRRVWTGVFALLLLAVPPRSAAARQVADRQATSPGALPGFTPASSARQRALEARFLAVPSAASASRTVRALTREPHLAGSPGGRAVAERLAAALERLGFQVRIERYDVYLPHPGEARVTLLVPARPDAAVAPAAATSSPLADGGRTRAAPDTGAHGSVARDVAAAGYVAHDLALRERVPGAAGGDSAASFLAWNAYAANGTVEGPVVYANYGLPADYAALERRGVEVRGKIVLARYGRSFRGVKVREAEERGAIGVLLYSDPAGDGYAAGDTLPAGPYRPAGAVQRGTVEYLWRYTGDPLTPGRPALPGVARLDPAVATTPEGSLRLNLPRIPVAPLPYGEAVRILEALGGPEPPAGFRGALPAAYRVGPGGARVRLEVRQAYAQRPIWNVIATIPGRTPQRVILGNHHDAWIYGGVDPHSGTAALLEVARGLGALRAKGWTPRRGIVVAFWDAEEFGAIGSTEWVEHHIDALRANAVAYFNVDMFTAGTLDVSGSPSLRDLVLSAAQDVADPLTGRPLADAWRARQRRGSDSGAGNGRTKPLLADLGAGSDWTAFFHFAGVPSLQWTMNGRGTYGVYHSVLDDFRYYRDFADSAFVYTPALARVMGLAALRLAEADALPFRYSHYADRIDAYIDALSRTRPADTGTAVLASGLDRLRARVTAFRRAAAAIERRQAEALAAGDTAALRRLNARLPAVERALLDDAGHTGRPWYRHQIYAPGRETGYDTILLPALVEAAVAGDAAAIDRALARIGAAIGRATDALEAAGLQRSEGSS